MALQDWILQRFGWCIFINSSYFPWNSYSYLCLLHFRADLRIPVVFVLKEFSEKWGKPLNPASSDAVREEL